MPVRQAGHACACRSTTSPYSWKRRTPDPRRALDHLLADGLAVARAGDAPPHDRRAACWSCPVRARRSRSTRGSGSGRPSRGRRWPRPWSSRRRPPASIERDVGTGAVTIARRGERRACRDRPTPASRSAGWVKERLTIARRRSPERLSTEMGSAFTYAKGAWQTRGTGTLHGSARPGRRGCSSADLDAWEGDARDLQPPRWTCRSPATSSGPRRAGRRRLGGRRAEARRCAGDQRRRHRRRYRAL